MPMGYDTLIGDMGTALSGGQQQRVLLARAFYKQPSHSVSRRIDEPSRCGARAPVNAAIQRAEAHTHHHRAPSGDDRHGGARHSPGSESLDAGIAPGGMIPVALAAWAPTAASTAAPRHLRGVH